VSTCPGRRCGPEPKLQVAESTPVLANAHSLLMSWRKFGLRSFLQPPPGRSRRDQGLTAAEMKRCHWVKPAMVCQIKFAEWTRDDRLRQPVFLGIREDKNAIEVVREKAS